MALNTGNSLFWKTGLDTKGVQFGANATVGILRGLMGSISRMDIFAAIGLGAALAFKKVISSAYKMSKEFEHTMKEVQTISYAVQQNFEGISKSVLELSTEVPDSAAKLTKALYQIVSAGYDGAEAFDILKTSAKLATASPTDTFSAADVITYVMNAYGKSAGTATQIADKLFTVVKLGKVKMEELAPTLSMVTGLTAEAGMSFQDLATFYAEAVKKIQPHIVSTGIRGFVTALMRASKEGSETGEAARRMGIEFDITTMKSKGLEYMLNQISAASEGQKEALMELFPNVRGLIGLLAAMTNEGENFKKTSEIIENSTGNMKQAFEVMVQDTTNQMAILHNNIVKKMKPIGDFLVQVVNDAAQEINKLFPNLKREIERFNVIENQYTSLEKKYVALSSKVNRTTQEQEDLNETIKELAKIVPGAVTAWDDYGNAIDINITKMRSLINLQRDAARRAEKKYLKNQIDQYDEFTKKITGATNEQKNAVKRNDEAKKSYGDFYNLQEKIKKQLADLKTRYKNGEISVTAYNKQIEYYNNLIKKKGIPINNEYEESYKNLNRINSEYSENLNNYRNQIDWLVNEISGFVDLTQKPKKIQFDLRQVGIDLSINKIKELQGVYQQLNAQGPIEIEGITVKATGTNQITYEQFLKNLAEAKDAMIELGKEKVLAKVGLDIDRASYEQLQTILKSIDDIQGLSDQEAEAVEIAVKFKISEIEGDLEKAGEELNLKEQPVIKPMFLYDQSDFDNLFSKLETMKGLGISVSEELTDAWSYYLEFIKKEYGEDSDNFRIALEQKKQAEKEYREWQEQQIIDQTELSRAMYDSLTNALHDFVTDMFINQKNVLSSLTNLWHNFANSVINELLRIAAQKMALSIIDGFSGGLKTIFDFVGGLFGPGIIGAANGLTNFVVPPGFPNDTYPMLFTSGEVVNAIPKNEVNNITNISNLVSHENVPVSNFSTSNIYNFDSNSIVKGLSDLRSSLEAKEMSVSVQNYMTGKFSKRDLAFIVNEGQKILKRTNA